MDTIPWLIMLRHISVTLKRDYEYVLKVHTKSQRHPGYPNWRAELMDSIAGSPERVKECIGLMDSRKTIGMIGPHKWILVSPSEARITHFESVLGIGPLTHSMFVGGTMFWARFAPLAEPIAASGTDLYAVMAACPVGYGHGETQPHIVERILGRMIGTKGYTVHGIGCVDKQDLLPDSEIEADIGSVNGVRSQFLWDPLAIKQLECHVFGTEQVPEPPILPVNTVIPDQILWPDDPVSSIVMLEPAYREQMGKQQGKNADAIDTAHKNLKDIVGRFRPVSEHNGHTITPLLHPNYAMVDNSTATATKMENSILYSRFRMVNAKSVMIGAPITSRQHIQPQAIKTTEYAGKNSGPDITIRFDADTACSLRILREVSSQCITVTFVADIMRETVTKPTDSSATVGSGEVVVLASDTANSSNNNKEKKIPNYKIPLTLVLGLASSRLKYPLKSLIVIVDDDDISFNDTRDCASSVFVPTKRLSAAEFCNPEALTEYATDMVTTCSSLLMSDSDISVSTKLARKWFAIIVQTPYHVLKMRRIASDFLCSTEGIKWQRTTTNCSALILFSRR